MESPPKPNISLQLLCGFVAYAVSFFKNELIHSTFEPNYFDRYVSFAAKSSVSIDWNCRKLKWAQYLIQVFQIIYVDFVLCRAVWQCGASSAISRNLTVCSGGINRKQRWRYILLLFRNKHWHILSKHMVKFQLLLHRKKAPPRQEMNGRFLPNK